MTTADQLRQMLQQILAQTPGDVPFLEDSREREIDYTLRSVDRWLEIIHIIEHNGTISRCLDIGTTPFTFALKRWCREVDTLDFNASLQGRCNAAGVTLYAGGRNWQDNLLPDNHYDCIIFLEVIEHMHVNPEKVISFLKQKLRNGGILILSTPNLMCFGNRLKMLFNLKLSHFHYPAFVRDEGDSNHFGHDRVYTPAEMREYFENTDWSSFQLGYHGMAVSDSVKGYPLLKQAARIPVQVIKRLVPSTRQLMLIVAKK